MSGAALRDLLRSPRCQGAGTLNLVAREPFWDPESLPFEVHGGGNVLRVVPQRGFSRENLAGSPDERLLVVDCPDDEGWLAPAGIVASWMDRHVNCAALDDVLLSHPLYVHTTEVDRAGLSRMGRGRLANWTPASPTLASVAEPPFRPDDRSAPPVNRRRTLYADAVVDLVTLLPTRFDLLEVEVAVRLSPGRTAEKR